MGLRSALIAACLVLASPGYAQERIQVVTTTTDLRSLTEAVGGERVAAVSLVPPNMDAEDYQPKPQDVLRLKNARMLVRVGLDYDLWVDRLLPQAGKLEISRGGPAYVDASFAIAVLELRGMSVGPGDGHAHGSGNPHYWLDPKNAEIITGNILEALGRIDPANAATYEANRQAFLARLNAKLAEWEVKLGSLKTMPIVAYHNSWPYFARRFRLDFVGFIETKPGVPPSPSNLAGIVQTMRARGVRIVVREPNEPERDVAFVANKTEASVVTLAASVGALPRTDDYISLFDANVEALTSARGQTMIEPLLFLWPSFLVAVCLVGIHAYFGIQVLARKVIFVDLALAQIAALGATVAFMLGHPAQSPATYDYSLAFTLLAAVLLAFTRAWGTRVPQEALIGVIYVVAAAAAILLIDRAPQGAEHLKQILTGNILTSGLNEVAVIIPLYAAVGVLHWLLRRRLTGTGSLVWEFIFYASFGVVVTSSVAIAGVLLVFSFLIIPAAIGVMFASSLARQLAIGWIVGTFTSTAGLAASFAFDFPTGAAMVCAFGAALAVAGLLYPFLRGDRQHALRVAIATARWTGAAILAGSAIQLAAMPRADQPLIDLIEYAVPSFRTVYFTRAELTTFVDASEYAERYRREAGQLNDVERRNRTQGVAFDDFVVARISSFLKSYGEMRKGEQFVMGEVRARARERVRWGASLGLLVFALLFAPVPWRRLRMRASQLTRCF